MILLGVPLEAPEVLPPDVAPPRDLQSLTLTWTALGRTWNLTDPASPVRRLKGATPTGVTEPTHWWSEAPMIDGATWDGFHIGRGEEFHPLLVHAENSTDFRTEHDAFMDTLDPRVEGVLRYTHADGSWRESPSRYDNGAALTGEVDPVLACSAVYGITWACADPYWRGAPVEVRFGFATGSAFFPGTPFTIGESNSLASAAVTNPGDVDAYPVWRVYGPFTAFTVGVGDSVVTLSLTKTLGHWVEIDMNPNKLTIVDDAGVDRWLSASEAEFSPIPGGQTVDLVTSLSGAGAGSAVVLGFTPRYRRAW